MQKQFSNFNSFYHYYLSQHQNPYCRLWHFIGSTLTIIFFIGALVLHYWLLLIAAIGVGYGCAWIGHFYIEKNKPATFNHPLYSLLADWVMYKDILCGKLSVTKK